MNIDNIPHQLHFERIESMILNIRHSIGIHQWQLRGELQLPPIQNSKDEIIIVLEREHKVMGSGSMLHYGRKQLSQAMASIVDDLPEQVNNLFSAEAIMLSMS